MCSWAHMVEDEEPIPFLLRQIAQTTDSVSPLTQEHGAHSGHGAATTLSPEPSPPPRPGLCVHWTLTAPPPAPTVLAPAHGAEDSRDPVCVPSSCVCPSVWTVLSGAEEYSVMRTDHSRGPTDAAAASVFRLLGKGPPLRGCANRIRWPAHVLSGLSMACWTSPPAPADASGPGQHDRCCCPWWGKAGAPRSRLHGVHPERQRLGRGGGSRGPRGLGLALHSLYHHDRQGSARASVRHRVLREKMARQTPRGFLGKETPRCRGWQSPAQRGALGLLLGRLCLRGT